MGAFEHGVDDPAAVIEQAMVAIRRSQGRRTLHRRRAGGEASLAEAATLAGWSADDRDALARLLRASVSSWERTTRGPAT